MIDCQTKQSEEAPAPLLSVASAPTASVVKTVAAQISVTHPNWELNERRLTKFVKKELNSSTDTAASSSSAVMTETTDTAKGKRIKFTSPIARLKKKKKAKEELLASAIKEAGPGGAGGDPASPVKMADLTTPAKDGAEKAEGPYKDDNEAESEPFCASCVIC